jgi:hypothetical protein
MNNKQNNTNNKFGQTKDLDTNNKFGHKQQISTFLTFLLLVLSTKSAAHAEIFSSQQYLCIKLNVILDNCTN